MVNPTSVLMADVAVPIPGRDVYSYRVPDDQADLAVGECVEVPLGRRKLHGFVLAIEQRPMPSFTLRDVGARNAEVRLPAALMRLVAWAAGYYRCTVGEFLSGVIPAGVRDGTQVRIERRVRAVTDVDVAGLTKRQREVYDALLAIGVSMDIAGAAKQVGCTTGVIERLVTAGAVTCETGDTVREVRLEVAAEAHAPNEEQQAVIDAVSAAMAEADSTPHLLYGVTGSGKTLVYQELAEQVITAGKKVLVLLPEIALTPQLAARFRQRFEGADGKGVVVWHSGFTAGERSHQWQAVASGGVDLVIGARSALFAPLPDIGLIVVDEEHEPSYKQETVPRYHARDLAVVYAQQLGIPVVLGTATPSLESYHNAVKGRYRIQVLRKRPAGGSLPTPHVIDMSAEWRKQRGQVAVADDLLVALNEVRQAKHQAIVLLNRRGWSPVVSCMGCGAAIKCDDCDVSLTYHRGAEELRCHYCGHQRLMPKQCPVCQQPDLSTKGLGTEQLAAVINEKVPGLRVLRLDADTVSGRQGHAHILSAFARGEADCLVGTQMVAKGLNFPNVTLVGIVAADHGLNIPDFRAAERTYQLIAQVAGRAGRGEHPGRVIVQAFDVEAEAITSALHHRAKSFYTRELSVRDDYGYPPHGGLARLLWRGPDAARVQQVAEAAGVVLRQLATGGETILGPNPAGLSFLKGQHRWHALIKTASRGVTQRFLDRLLQTMPLREQKGVKVALDVDPYQIT